MRKYFMFLSLMLCMLAHAQNLRKLSLTYEYTSDDPTITPQAAEMMAFEEAKLQALENAFGVDIEHLSAEVMNERNLQTDSKYYSFTQMAPRGEWIETLNQQVVDKEFVNGFWHVTVNVEGNARAKTHADIEIKTRITNSLKEQRSRKEFYDGDDLYLFFSSPIDGYVCVYLADEEGNVFCLLPQEQENVGSRAVKANKEYVFFSEQFDANADELILRKSHDNEHNMVYVIFSPNDFTKAVDKQSQNNIYDERVPRMLEYVDFLKWLAKNQKRDIQMVVNKMLLVIN